MLNGSYMKPFFSSSREHCGDFYRLNPSNGHYDSATIDSRAAINQVIKPLFKSYDIFGLLARSSLCYAKAEDTEVEEDGSLCERCRR